MLRVAEFSPDHRRAAAAMVAASAAARRRAQPLLPGAIEDEVGVATLLQDVSAGVAAEEDGRLAGFICAYRCTLWGSPGAYVPEWGWAATHPEVIPYLYQEACRRWLGEGRFTHGVTIWATRPQDEAAWHSVGFGRVVVDAARDLEPPVPVPAVEVRQATVADAEAAARMELALWEHLAAPPVCRQRPVPEGEAATALRLGHDRRPMWLALERGRVIGFMSFEPGGSGPAALESPQTVRCDGAYVLPEHRRTGAGTALFSRAMDWAGRAGFSRCALDFESANLGAVRFWQGLGFDPVLNSVARIVPSAPGAPEAG